MWNPFIIIWNTLNPRREDEMEKIPGEEHIRKYTPSILSFIFVTLLLIVSVDFYIDIQNVPNLQTRVEGNYIVHNWSYHLSADVNVVYDYSKGDDLNDDKVGVTIAYIDSSVPYFFHPELQRVFKGKRNENNEQIYNARDGFQLITWDHPISGPLSTKDSLILVNLTQDFITNWPDEEHKAKSINSVAHFCITDQIPLKCWDLFRIKSPLLSKFLYGDTFNTYNAGDETSETRSVIEGPAPESFLYAKQTPNNENLSVTLDFFRFSKEMGGKTFYKVIANSPMHKRCGSILVSQDISRAIITYKCEGVLNMNSLRFSFIGATEFSEMIPTPDVRDYNSVLFTDSAKLAKIKSDGITFHAKFSDMENLQQTRNFVVTLILSLLISLFFKNLYDIFKYKIKHFYIENNTFSVIIIYSLIVVSIIVTILFLGRPWSI